MLYGTYHFVSWFRGFNNPVAYSLKYKIGLLKKTAVLFEIQGKSMFPHILLVVDEISFHESVQTRFVAPQIPSIDTFWLLK